MTANLTRRLDALDQALALRGGNGSQDPNRIMTQLNKNYWQIYGDGGPIPDEILTMSWQNWQDAIDKVYSGGETHDETDITTGGGF